MILRQARGVPQAPGVAHNVRMSTPETPRLRRLVLIALALSLGAAVSLGITRFAYGLLLPVMKLYLIRAPRAETRALISGFVERSRTIRFGLRAPDSAGLMC